MAEQQEPIITVGLTREKLELIPEDVIQNFWAFVNSSDMGIGQHIDDFGPWLIFYYNGWIARNNGLKQLDMFSGE